MPHSVVIELPEHWIRPIPTPSLPAVPEIVPPAAKHGRQFHDDRFHVFPTVPPAAEFSYALAEFLHRLGAWPPAACYTSVASAECSVSCESRIPGILCLEHTYSLRW